MTRSQVLLANLRKVGTPTLAFLAVGFSGFMLLAAGPRILGPVEYSKLAVAWTILQAFGVGLGSPAEQTISRGVAGGVAGGLVPRVRKRLMWLSSISLAIPLAGLLGLDVLFDNALVWSVSVVLGVFGWAAVEPPRGSLSGAGRFDAYAGVVTVEAATRMAFVGLAWLGVGPVVVLLGCSLWVPMWTSAAVAAVLIRRSPGQTHVEDLHSEHDALSYQVRFTLVAVAGQIALSFGSVWLQAVSADPTLAGRYVSALTYMRIPITLVGGLVVVVLSATAAAFSRGERAVARSIAVRSAVSGGGLGLALTTVLLVVAPWGLRIFYGSELELGSTTLVLMGAGTVAAMVAGILTQSLFGCSMGRVAAAIWAGVALAVALLSVFSGSSVVLLAGVVFLGQAVAASALGTRLRVGLR